MQTALGTAMIVYGGSSLSGYFNLGSAPLARLSRMGIWSVLLSIFAFIAFLTNPNGISALGLASVGLLAIDATQATNPEVNRER